MRNNFLILNLLKDQEIVTGLALREAQSEGSK